MLPFENTIMAAPMKFLKRFYPAWINSKKALKKEDDVTLVVIKMQEAVDFSGVPDVFVRLHGLRFHLA